jgi:hypothetical protein
LKEVYNYAENGVYIGPDVAQESPLEPGVFLMPRNSTDVKPPKAKKGFFIVWDKELGDWKQISEFQMPKDEVSPVLSTEEGERNWRNNELQRADVEINKAQDGDGVGTVKAWRDYRKALRAYPTVTGFPDAQFRPVAPDVAA